MKNKSVSVGKPWYRGEWLIRSVVFTLVTIFNLIMIIANRNVTHEIPDMLFAEAIWKIQFSRFECIFIVLEICHYMVPIYIGATVQEVCVVGLVYFF